MKERPVTAVLGAGTMGAGIAQVLASAGYPVHLWDIGEQPLARGVDGILKRLNRQVEKGRLSQEEADGTFARVRTTSRLEELASADWVIEAVVERLQVKRELFTRLEAVTGEEAVLATNTSSSPSPPSPPLSGGRSGCWGFTSSIRPRRCPWWRW